MTATEVEVPARFNGPPRSGNGGWTAGLLASALPDAPAVRVALRAPPPLDTPLRLEAAGGRATLTGDVLVAEAEAVEPPALDPPPPPTPSEAAEAETRFEWAARHPFPTCFVCGPDRAPGDGLRLFPGPVADRPGLYAAPWTPPEDVDLAITWAALDCPSCFPCSFAGTAVLASLTAELRRPPAAGAPHVVTSWLLHHEGRKHRSATALHGPDGELVALAEALWVELRDPAALL